MPLQLRLTAPQGQKHGKRYKLPRFEVDAGSGYVITKAIGRYILLDVHLICW